MTKKILIVVPVALAVAAAAFLLMKEPAIAPEAPPALTRETALELLKPGIESCLAEGEAERYRSCTLEIVPAGARATVTVTHDGFFDDSVKASRVTAVFAWRSGAWTVLSSFAAHRCWPDRGHQDFSSEPCI